MFRSLLQVITALQDLCLVSLGFLQVFRPWIYRSRKSCLCWECTHVDFWPQHTCFSIRFQWPRRRTPNWIDSLIFDVFFGCQFEKFGWSRPSISLQLESNSVPRYSLHTIDHAQLLKGIMFSWGLVLLCIRKAAINFWTWAIQTIGVVFFDPNQDD